MQYSEDKDDAAGPADDVFQDFFLSFVSLVRDHHPQANCSPANQKTSRTFRTHLDVSVGNIPWRFELVWNGISFRLEARKR